MLFNISTELQTYNLLFYIKFILNTPSSPNVGILLNNFYNIFFYTFFINICLLILNYSYIIIFKLINIDLKKKHLVNVVFLKGFTIYIFVNFILWNNLFISPEMLFLFGHFKITATNYNIIILLITFLQLFTITRYYYNYTSSGKVSFGLPFEYVNGLFLTITALFCINSLIGFFFCIEIASLFYFLILINLPYSMQFTGRTKNQLLVFKKNYYTIVIYFWSTAFISLGFYFWYYLCAYLMISTQLTFLEIDLNVARIINGAGDIQFELFFLFFVLFIILKGGWFPFILWKLLFVKWLPLEGVVVYILLYYTPIYLYFNYFIGSVVNLADLALPVYIFILIVAVLPLILAAINTPTSLNTFFVLSSILNALIIFLLILTQSHNYLNFNI